MPNVMQNVMPKVMPNAMQHVMRDAVPYPPHARTIGRSGARSGYEQAGRAPRRAPTSGRAVLASLTRCPEARPSAFAS